MPGLDSEELSNGTDHLSSKSSSELSRRATTEQSTDKTSSLASQGLHIATANGSSDGVRKFTSEELSQLNRRHNAHVAYRGKVCGMWYVHLYMSCKFHRRQPVSDNGAQDAQSNASQLRSCDSFCRPMSHPVITYTPSSQQFVLWLLANSQQLYSYIP